jgi:hypothetical protein
MYLIREKLFRLGDRAEITDESGTTVLSVDGPAFSLRNRLVLRDPAGTAVAEVHRRLATLRPTYQITVSGERVAEVRKAVVQSIGCSLHRRRCRPGSIGHRRRPAGPRVHHPARRPHGRDRVQALVQRA